MENAPQLSQTPLIPIVEGRFMAEVGTTWRIPLALIVPNPEQPRKLFDPGEIQANALSYKRRGDVEKAIDVVIRTNPDGTNFAFIEDGESRWRAAKLPITKLESISCYIKVDRGNNEIFLSSAVANIRRKEFSVIEKALAIFEIQTRFNLDQNAAGAELGMEPSTVSYLMPFLDLHETIQMLVMQGKLGAGNARLLAKLKPADQIGRLKTIAEAVKANGGKSIHPNKMARILRGEMERKGIKHRETERGRKPATHAQLVGGHLMTSANNFLDALKEFSQLGKNDVKNLTNPHFIDIEKELRTIVTKSTHELERLAQHA